MAATRPKRGKQRRDFSDLLQDESSSEQEEDEEVRGREEEGRGGGRGAEGQSRRGYPAAEIEERTPR